MDLDKILGDIDFNSLVSHQAKIHEVKYPHKTVFKYLLFPREEALKRWVTLPSLKFSTRLQLNDEFELSRRWSNFSIPPNEAQFLKLLNERILYATRNIQTFVQFLQATQALKGTGITKCRLLNEFKSPGGNDYFYFAREKFIKELQPKLKEFFITYRSIETETMDRVISSIGIASFTETSTNKSLWSFYAGNGAGFIVELNTDKVSSEDGSHPRLMKVLYQDEKFENFWDNPYSLALIKHNEFSFEKEWRLIEKLERINPTTMPSGEIYYLRNLTVGSINSIILGYKIDAKHVKIIDEIRLHDQNIVLKQAIADRSAGEIVIRDF